MASIDAVLARLEAITARLERLEGGSGASAPAGAESNANVSPAGAKAIEAFEEYFNATVPAFVAASKAIPDLVEIGNLSEAAWKNQLDFVKAAASSKKPTDQQILAFLGPTAQAIEKSNNMDFKSPAYAHLQAFNASIPALSYPLLPNGACSHIEGMIDSGTMYLNRILMKAKDLPDAEKEAHRKWVAAYKALLAGLFEFVKAHYKMGVSWNPKGDDFTAYGSGASAAPAKAVAAPVAAPAAAAPVKADKPVGIANVFGELSKGLAITSGLNKVTDDMKAKNMKDVPPVVVAPKVAVKKDNLPAITKPAVFEYKGSNWFIENQQDNQTLTVTDAKMQDGVYIGNCRNSTVVITGKPKSVALDKCFRVTVRLENALSSVEFVNCDRSHVYISGTVPTIAIDKSKGIVVNLSEAAVAQNPDIITSNISECNIQIPGASEEEHIYEMPIPEQYLTKLAGRKLQTNEIKHG